MNQLIEVAIATPYIPKSLDKSKDNKKLMITVITIAFEENQNCFSRPKYVPKLLPRDLKII